MNLEKRPQGDVHNTFHPPESFSFNDATMRWHPKITVYRLLVLLTTICLGVGKAAMSARGAISVSVTMEWVSGVAVFVLLYGVGLYDEDNQQQRMNWLFNKDLAAYLWSVSYRTEEVGLAPGFRHPPITGYRIAVTVSIVFFGAGKATLGYLGFSPAANTVDWVFAVVVTSALYYIGLYEHNSMKIFPKVFTTDYGSSLRRVSFAFILPSLGLIFSLGVIYASALLLIYQRNHQFKVKRRHVDPKADPSFLSSAYNACINLMIADFLLMTMDLGFFGLYYTLSRMKKTVFPDGLVKAIRRALHLRSAEELPVLVRRNHGAVDIGVRIAIYIFRILCVVYVGALATFMLCWSISTWEDDPTVDAGRWTVLFTRAVSVIPWAFLLGLVLLVFIHTIRGSL